VGRVSKINPKLLYSTFKVNFAKQKHYFYNDFFRKSLSAVRAPPGLISDAFDIKLNITAQNQLKKIKTQVGRFDTVCL